MAPISGHEEQEVGLSIGAAALQTGHTPVTLRHWERLGLIDPPPRRGGRRRYPPSVATRVALIDIARAAGFRLAEIRELLADRDPRRTAGERWRALAARKRAQLDEAAAAIQGAAHAADPPLALPVRVPRGVRGPPQPQVRPGVRPLAAHRSGGTGGTEAAETPRPALIGAQARHALKPSSDTPVMSKRC
ncbi:MAG: MerR family transcriptional regulator [Chloroflexota bacterium]|nr:MerR family transcriptional regulator [Chloroflexota bacterium]